MTRASTGITGMKSVKIESKYISKGRTNAISMYKLQKQVQITKASSLSSSIPQRATPTDPKHHVQISFSEPQTAAQPSAQTTFIGGQGQSETLDNSRAGAATFGVDRSRALSASSNDFVQQQEQPPASVTSQDKAQTHRSGTSHEKVLTHRSVTSQERALTHRSVTSQSKAAVQQSDKSSQKPKTSSRNVRIQKESITSWEKFQDQIKKKSQLQAQEELAKRYSAEKKLKTPQKHKRYI